MATISITSERLLEICEEARQAANKRVRPTGFQMTVQRRMPPMLASRAQELLDAMEASARNAMQLGGQGHTQVSLSSEDTTALRWLLAPE